MIEHSKNQNESKKDQFAVKSKPALRGGKSSKESKKDQFAVKSKPCAANENSDG